MKFLLPLLICLRCVAQDFTFEGPAVFARSAGSSFTLRSTPALKFLVDYRDYATNNTQLSSITDSIGGLAWSQAATSLQPTGTVNGIRYNGSIASCLTNASGLSIASNFTFFAYFQCDSSWNSGSVYMPLLANATGPVGFYGQSGTRAATFYFGGDHLGSANNYFANGTWCLWVWANGNSYTNGTLWGATTIPSSYPVNLVSIGSAGGHNSGGLIKFIGITTNTMTTGTLASLWNLAQSY